MKEKCSYGNLTIVSIGLKNDEDLRDTYRSIKGVLDSGAKWNLILSSCAETLGDIAYNKLVVGRDTSLYNALNIGMKTVDTEYFMFLHCGDCIMPNKFEEFWLIKANVDLNLGGAMIGKRRHLSRRWRPWMLSVYVQPPHLPILYKTEMVKNVSFREDIKVVADYYMVKSLFKRKLTWEHSDVTFIRMNEGGLTTSGVKSILIITLNFFRVDGMRALILAPLRVLIKRLLK